MTGTSSGHTYRLDMRRRLLRERARTEQSRAANTTASSQDSNDVSAESVLTGVAERWARVDILGRKRHVGAVLDVTRFGVAGVEIVEPQVVGDPKRYWYAGKSVFGVEYMSQAEVEAEIQAEREFHRRPALPPSGLFEGELDKPQDEEDDL